MDQGLVNGSASVRSRAHEWGGGRCVVILGALALLVTTTGPAAASPIRSHRHIVTEAQLGPRWRAFLAGGPSRWALRPSPAIPTGLVLTYNSLGQIVDTPLAEYLKWRRSLNPTRFDRYHPYIGPPLAQTLVPPPLTPTPTPTPPINPQPQIPGVPEPASLLVGVVLMVAAATWRRHKAQRLVHAWVWG